MAVYQCMVCGMLYDEEKEGKPVSELACCPVCRQPVSKLVPVAEQTRPAPPPPPAAGLEYDRATARQDPSARYMEQIHEMAVTGRSIGGSMSTRMPMAS